MTRSLFITALLLAAGAVSFSGGCSPQERMGLSPLPQNQPVQWSQPGYVQYR